MQNNKKNWSLILLCAVFSVAMAFVMVHHFPAYADGEIKVTFNADGGEVTPTEQVVNAENKIDTLPTPTKEGYNFEGWYTSAQGGEQVTPDTVFAASTTIYARWACNHELSTEEDDGNCTTALMCSVCGGVKYEAQEHTYSHACDTVCNNNDNTCTFTRETEHVFAHDCDTDCNVVGCGFERETEHVFDHDCDKDCNVSGCTFKRETAHVYHNDCDFTCNTIGCPGLKTEEERTAHVFDDKKDADCNVCGLKRTIASTPNQTDKPSSNNNNDQTPEEKGLGKGAIIGIAVGGGVLVVVGVPALYWFVLKKKTWADLLQIFKKK